MPSVSRLIFVLATALALAACGSEEKKGKDQRTAAGQILPGSISDAMLPYDTVRSQPPLAPQATGSGSAKDKGATDEGPGDPPVDPVDAGPATPTAAPIEAPVAPAE